jgi:hypothetical protein
VKVDVMGRAYSTNGVKEQCLQDIGGIAGGIILGWIFDSQGGAVWTGLIWLR